MSDYIEVFKPDSTKCQFFDIESGKTVERICPTPINNRIIDNDHKDYTEIQYSNCPVHGDGK